MVATSGVTPTLQAIADEVAKVLSFAKISGHSAFITTAVAYANGTAVVVRIDQVGKDFFVSDDGYGALTAEMMGALPTFVKVAGGVAKRSGVEFDQRAFFILHADREQLPAAVSIIANVSAAAVERTIYALESVRAKRSRSTFQERLFEAYGEAAQFDVEVQGVTRTWEFAGVVKARFGYAAVFEFVAPAFNSVATANMKIGDVRGMMEAPQTIAALADYDATEPSLRAILSNVADRVIPVSTSATEYRLAA